MMILLYDIMFYLLVVLVQPKPQLLSVIKCSTYFSYYTFIVCVGGVVVW